MAGFYGYNPAEYQQDFSWIGDMGKTLSSMAMKFPELTKLNKEIKTNADFNKQAYSEFIKHIETMDKQMVDNIAAQMKIDGTTEERREAIKKMIPVPDYKKNVKGEEYAKNAATNYLTKLVSAGQAAGYDYSKLMANVPGAAVEQTANTFTGKTASQTEQRKIQMKEQTEARTAERGAIREEQTQQAEDLGVGAQQLLEGATSVEEIRNNAKEFGIKDNRIVKDAEDRFRKDEQLAMQARNLSVPKLADVNIKKLDDVASSVNNQIKGIEKRLAEEKDGVQKRQLKLHLRSLNKDLDKIFKAKEIQESSGFQKTAGQAKSEAAPIIEREATERAQEQFGTKAKTDIRGIIPFLDTPREDQAKKFKEMTGKNPVYDKQGKLSTESKKLLQDAGVDIQGSAGKIAPQERSQRAEFKKYSTDNGIPYTSAEFQKWLQSQGK